MAQAQRHKQGKGKKGRKHGRILRSPAHQRYNAERRWIRHKAARINRYRRRHPAWQIPADLSAEVRCLL
jgi:hypothetical protein